MKILLDTTCGRCGNTTSISGLDASSAQAVRDAHVCPDGTRVPSGQPTERRVYGPGERLYDREVFANLLPRAEIFEIERAGSWLVVTEWIFRSWTGGRRLNGVPYLGPIFLLGTQEVTYRA